MCKCACILCFISTRSYVCVQIKYLIAEITRKDICMKNLKSKVCMYVRVNVCVCEDVHIPSALVSFSLSLTHTYTQTHTHTYTHTHIHTYVHIHTRTHAHTHTHTYTYTHTYAHTHTHTHARTHRLRV